VCSCALQRKVFRLRLLGVIVNTQRIAETPVINRAKGQALELDDAEFDIILDVDLRAVVVADYHEAHLALGVGAYKAAALMAAGVVEGILLEVLRQPDVIGKTNYGTALSKYRRNGRVEWERLGLVSLAEVVQNLGLLRSRTLKLAQGF
jgi:hypothetical protein